MDQSKPFKTIEVIDSRTGNVCKIACMSCIRGHRTTSCGNTACRAKVLWTIKRPGRPANTCTCPYGRTGRCQCVVAQSACPHKPKKGEKRSMDCRCDEKGRWCCMLGSDGWDALMAMQKPRVDFFPTPEAMTATQQALVGASTMPVTPSAHAGATQERLSLPSTPQPTAEVPQTPASQVQHDTFSNSTYQIPRFGFMGVGLPMGNGGHHGEDVLTWEGDAPLAPRDFPTYPNFSSPDSTTIASSSMLSTAPTTPSSHFTETQLQTSDFLPVTRSFEQISMNSHDPSQGMPTEWMQDYFNYQFPSAICQNCGMNGCTCKNCPAVMQSTMDGSWAQCCSRKHVRAIAPLPARIVQQDQETLIRTPIPNGSVTTAGSTNGGLDSMLSTYGLEDIKFVGDQPFLTDINEFDTPADSDMMDFNEFVVPEPPEPPNRGCCCGGQR